MTGLDVRNNDATIICDGLYECCHTFDILKTGPSLYRSI